MKQTITKTTIVITLLFAMLLQTMPLVSAQQTATAKETDINEKIRAEGMNNSQILKTLHFLSDVYGPRLTGSPNLKAAGDWAVKQMFAWDFDNARLEGWDFGHPGWVNERASGFITAPVQDSLVFEVLAWTPGTKGAVSGNAVRLNIPRRQSEQNPQIFLPPTQAELTAYFESVKNNIRGKMVLVGEPAFIPVNINPPPKRIDDEEIRKRFDPAPAAGPSPVPTPQTPARPRPTPTAPNPNQLTAPIGEQLDKFLLDNGAAVRITDAGREHGQIRAFNNRSFDVAKVVPTVVMRNEDYGRIWRLLSDNTPVLLEFDIRNRTIPEGTTSYNTIGEIVGTDKKDEVIMLGGHLDSWHAATGATDNAIGCAIMMEAARILKAVGVKP
ncbi:MAG: M28 family peptidase, partial [Pyrinomonadaceae bacterium]